MTNGYTRTSSAFQFDNTGGGALLNNGGIWWENVTAAVSGSAAQNSDAWTANITGLAEGENIICVYGSNIWDIETSDTNIISRETYEEGLPQIATNALIFPSANSELLEGDLTNIIWHINRIADDFDGTNLTFSKISVHFSENTNEVDIVTNDVSNLLGEIPWLVPENLVGGDTNYVLKFEVVDSSFLTNSMIFWNNKFTIVPESGMLLFFVNLILVICYLKRSN